MSLGWLTESSILPKKAKEIKAQQTSLMGLKALVISGKPQTKLQQEGRKIMKVVGLQKNKGIEQRCQKDMIVQKQKMVLGQKKLAEKEKVYQNLETKGRNHKDLLVDFSEKKREQGEGQQFQDLRKQFYEGKLNEIRRQRENVDEGTVQDDLRQRLAWEKEVMEELKDGGVNQERSFILQSFDHHLSEGQKKALLQVRRQMDGQQAQIKQVRRLREDMDEQRLRKLRKLNIL